MTAGPDPSNCMTLFNKLSYYGLKNDLEACFLGQNGI